MHATDASANDEHVAARLPEDARGDALELSIILHSASDDHEVCLEELHRGGDVAVGSERLREQGAELSAKQVRRVPDRPWLSCPRCRSRERA